MKHSQRGAALIETALALPVILAALYGVTWGIRAGTVSERAESAVRYAGVISAQANPYHDYSLYSLYNNLGTTSNVTTSNCQKPIDLFLSGGKLPVTIPGTAETQQVTPTFWQPDLPPELFCDNTPVRQYFTGVTRSYLLLQSVPIVNTVVSDGSFFGAMQLRSSSQAKYKFYRTPDMATLMHCANALSSAVSASLAPLKYGSANSRLQPLQPSDFNSQPLTLSTNCISGIGTEPVPSTPPPIDQSGGNTASPRTPGPGSSPTPPPSPFPTATPATPKPSATPAPSPTPTAKPSPTPSPASTGGTGGGGGGGSGGGSPTPSPSPTAGKGGTPSPPPCCGKPSGAPSASPSPKPSASPATPKPSASPATPKPSATPTAKPTATPVPSPSPSQPPGSVS